ncbi:MAG: RNA methyltransferase [Bacteroidetes bacterium]|nr:RNA methyltransferase [Bacteroidota bacterium]
MTEKRYNKLAKVISHRQEDLTVVLENIHDPHNVSAIFRSVESIGVDKVYLVYNTNKFPRIGKFSSASAKKWVKTEKFSTAEACFKVLREQGFKIYTTHLSEEVENVSLYDLDLTEKCAIVVGNEHAGVSDEAVQLSDKNFVIPMYGMIQSLNVSVSAAICVYEALRQREKKGMYRKEYTHEQILQKIEQITKK